MRALHDMTQPVDLGDQPPRLVEQRGAGIGDAHRSLGALEQQGADLQFQVLDVLGERRLGQREPLRRAAEMQFFGDGHEAAQGA